MNPKKRTLSGDNSRRITDYFTRRKSSDVGTTVAASASEERTSLGRRDSQKSEGSGTFQNPSRPSKSSLRIDSNASTLLKRMRSSDAEPRSKATSATSGSKRSKRQKKFDSDSDVDMADLEVIYVKSPRRPEGPIKPSPIDSVTTKRCEMVPTSQSDELDLDLDMARDVIIMERDAKEVRRCVEQWRLQATPNELGDEDSRKRGANVQSSPLSSIPLTPRSLSSEPDLDLLLPGLPTPPVSENATARSPSVAFLDEKTMTEHILEKIKSDASARAQQLQDSPPLQFDEFPDSSSDEGESSFAIQISPERKGRRISEHKTTILSSPKPAVDHRHLLRNRKPKAASPKISDKHGSALPKSVELKAAVPGKAVTKTYNPLDALLSEKRKLEKSGKGTEAFMQAESTVGMWAGGDAGGDEFLEKWRDEDAVRNVIQEMLMNDQSYFEDGNAQDVSLDAEGTAKIIGINGSKVADILKRDKTMEEPIHVMVHGPRLWVESGNDPEKCISMSHKNHTFQHSGGHPVVSVLKMSLDKDDYAQVISILDSGILASIDLSVCESLPLFLCEQAFSPMPGPLALSSFHSLLSIYADARSSAARFNSLWLLRVLSLLGAEPSVMKLMGYCPSDASPIFLDVDHRAGSVLRLLHVLKTITRSQRIEIGDIPNMIITLARVALDPSASHQVRLDVTSLVGDLCNLATPDVEKFIYEKAASFTCTLALSCKTQLLCMFSRGSRASRRISRWVAYSTLANQVFSDKLVGAVPPLKDLLDIVQSSEVFQIHDGCDYMVLWHYVQILGIVLTDVELYDAAERNMAENSTDLSPDKHKSKHKIILIHETLEGLHAMIQDTRALHLDRSRAKGAIKQLSLRLSYQHSDSEPRRKTLDHFFTPKKRQ